MTPNSRASSAATGQTTILLLLYNALTLGTGQYGESNNMETRVAPQEHHEPNHIYAGHSHGALIANKMDTSKKAGK